jgi:hypothetical protein
MMEQNSFLGLIEKHRAVIDQYILSRDEQQAALEEFRERSTGADVQLWQLIEFQFRCQVAKMLEMIG